MADNFKLEIHKSFGRTVGIRVIANSVGWSDSSPSTNLKISGRLTPEAALLLAKELELIATEVAAANAKKDAQEQRRRDRLSKLPRIGFR